MGKFVNIQLQENAIFYEVVLDIIETLQNKWLSEQHKEKQSAPNKELAWETNHIIPFPKIPIRMQEEGEHAGIRESRSIAKERDSAQKTYNTFRRITPSATTSKSNYH